MPVPAYWLGKRPNSHDDRSDSLGCLIYINLYKLPKGDVVAITSVDVDKSVIAEIKSLTGLKTDREVIHESLTRTLALARQEELLTRMKSRVFNDDQISEKTIDYSQ